MWSPDKWDLILGVVVVSLSKTECSFLATSPISLG